MTPLTLVALGTLLAVASMTLLFALGRRLRNFSVVDVGWAGNFALLALLWGSLAAGLPARRLLVGAMYALWGLRLAAHLGARIVGAPEEGRYADLRLRWGADGERALEARMYRFYLLQAVLDVLLALPLLIALANPAPVLLPLEWLGAAIWAVGLAGETLADLQLGAFKRSGQPPHAVCERGLWRYSRHPNYFFEWLVWVGYATVALASPPWGYAAVAMPALMLYFLLRVTGIPATEAQALRSKGEAYRDYQRRTNAFVPGPRRR
jgi:steroid 5-alpha reductase family enzyme